MANRNGSSKKSERLRAAIYARVSSKQQAEAKTIASQIEALKARVLADGLQLESELSFIDEGYSGGTLLRPVLERLRDQAAAGTFDTGRMFTRQFVFHVATRIRCCWSRNYNDMASRSLSSIMTSAGRPRRICCSKFRG